MEFYVNNDSLVIQKDGQCIGTVAFCLQKQTHTHTYTFTCDKETSLFYDGNRLPIGSELSIEPIGDLIHLKEILENCDKNRIRLCDKLNTLTGGYNENWLVYKNPYQAVIIGITYKSYNDYLNIQNNNHLLLEALTAYINKVMTTITNLTDKYIPYYTNYIKLQREAKQRKRLISNIVCISLTVLLIALAIVANMNNI